MKRDRTLWTNEQVEDFRRWHSQRLQNFPYSKALVDELTQAREQWLAGVKKK